ncbi:MAG: 4-alpha-glucanotransferase [Actinomycetota bacterium]
MIEESLNPVVQHLASEAGVATTWVDAWGNPQTVTEADLLGVLAAVTGRSLDSERSIVEAASEIRQNRPRIEPVLVAWDGLLTIPAVSFDVTEATVVLESGEVIPVEVSAEAMRVTNELPTGYHQLLINGGSVTAHVFSAPVVAHPWPRHALGLLAPMYSLRDSSSQRGIGTIAEMDVIADMCHDAGIEIVGTLPLLATFPDQPSPYAPVSRRAWSELFVDFSSVPGWSEDPQHRGTDPLWVDYEGTGSRIRESLARYARYVSDSPQLRSRVESYLRRMPDMVDYARFRALGERYGINPAGWPQGAEPPPERVRYHETVQWLMDLQLSGMSERLRDRGQYLYLDLPIGCHPDGYDIWDQPELFARAGLGAPPDPLFVGGQDWGLPATIPSAARADGHTNFRKAIRHQLSVAGLLRIDHVMGIHRTWWVPRGAGANQGAYVMQPTEEMFAIICIESSRAGTGIVGENLGTVPPRIGQGLQEHGLLGMTVAQDGPHVPAPTDLIAMSSHDTPAFAAWWKGLDISDMVDLGIFDDERAVHERESRKSAVSNLESYFSTSGPMATRDALMEWIAGTDAAIALLNLDDLLMEERRQNVPGTYLERPNWRLRNPRTVDDLATDEGFTGQLSHLAAIRKS